MSGSHITIFIPSFRGGGAERAMINLANGLCESYSRRGIKIQVSLLVVDDSGDYRDEVNHSVRVHSLSRSRALWSFFGLIQFYNVQRPDVVISSMPHLNVLATFARRFSTSRPKIIVTERNTYSELRKHGSRKDRFLHIFVKRSYLSADAIVAVSEGVADDLCLQFSFERKDINVIYNPVVSNQIFERMVGDVDLGISHDLVMSKFVIAMGSLEERKGFRDLIRAFHIVTKTDDAVNLVILGEGSKRRELESLIIRLRLQTRVFMPGFVTNPFPILKNAQVFILSSVVEGLPNVLIQAMACGVPVVATDCPSGPQEILEGGKWGYLVPVGDANSMASAILEQLSGVFPRLPVEQRARFFSVDRAVNAYEDLIGRVIGDSL